MFVERFLHRKEVCHVGLYVGHSVIPLICKDFIILGYFMFFYTGVFGFRAVSGVAGIQSKVFSNKEKNAQNHYIIQLKRESVQ